MKFVLLSSFALLVSGSFALAKDPIVGDWKWSSGTVVSFSIKGEVVGSGGNRGKWVALPGRSTDHKYTVTWENGRFVDQLELSKDKLTLTGFNQAGHPITGNKWSKK